MWQVNAYPEDVDNIGCLLEIFFTRTGMRNVENAKRPLRLSCLIITNHVRSMREGNDFSRVCLFKIGSPSHGELITYPMV